MFNIKITAIICPKSNNILRYLSMAILGQRVDESIRSRAKKLEKIGRKPVDATWPGLGRLGAIA